MSATTICFANQKGGVAKSTTCVSTARVLSGKGANVLVVDTDQQGNAASGLRVKRERDDAGLFELLRDLAEGDAVPDIHEAIVEAYGVDLLPASWKLAKAEVEFTQLGKERMLSKLLAQVSDEYDYILVDTPPNLGYCVLNALTASDWLVVPCTPTLWGNAAINELLKTVAVVREYSNPNLGIAGILITDAEMRTNSAQANRSLSEAIADSVDVPVFKTAIPHSVKVREALDACSDIITEGPSSKPAIAYKAFVDELAHLIAYNDDAKRHGKQVA